MLWHKLRPPFFTPLSGKSELDSLYRSASAGVPPLTARLTMDWNINYPKQQLGSYLIQSFINYLHVCSQF